MSGFHGKQISKANGLKKIDIDPPPNVFYWLKFGWNTCMPASKEILLFEIVDDDNDNDSRPISSTGAFA